MIDALRDFLVELPRSWKRAVMVAGDCGGALLALAGAMFLQDLPAAALNPWWQVPVVLAAVVAAAAGCRLYSAIIRYIAFNIAFRVWLTAIVAVAVLVFVGTLFPTPLLRVDVLINFGFLLLLALGMERLLARQFLSHVSDREAERLLIYGAGEAGVQAANALEGDRSRRVVGFIDDRDELRRKEVADHEVHHANELPDVLREKDVDTVLLALPSVSRQRKQEIVAQLDSLPVNVKTVPSLQEVLSGRTSISEIRDIDIEDLLGRDPVPPDRRLLLKSISGRAVMVTGAGGSIGGELCRQIVRLWPEHLVLFEANECSLYHIERELLPVAEKAGVRITAVLGNTLDRELVEACIRDFGVRTLYHSAAYKHVPLVESNVRAALRNNIFGTRNTAEAALAAGVERFILVSTDKAVRPTSVMGASKRVAELVVQAMAERAGRGGDGDPARIFSMVRFGNVLGSSGSVVPQFREQIRAGGPVTVTHPEITRYFMTTPEAAQLVIQAGAMARGGEVFVLDMGEPIRILDLARRMIRLAGLTVRDENNPDGDIGIEFIGLRPGEKLYEELLIDGSTLESGHPKIGQARETSLDWEELEAALGGMAVATEGCRDDEIKRLLRELVPGYTAPQENYDIIGRRERITAREKPS